MSTRRFMTNAGQTVTFTPGSDSPDKGAWSCGGCGLKRGDSHVSYAEEHADQCREF